MKIIIAPIIIMLITIFSACGVSDSGSDGVGKGPSYLPPDSHLNQSDSSGGGATELATQDVSREFNENLSEALQSLGGLIVGNASSTTSDANKTAELLDDNQMSACFTTLGSTIFSSSGDQIQMQGTLDLGVCMKEIQEAITKANVNDSNIPTTHYDTLTESADISLTLACPGGKLSAYAGKSFDVFKEIESPCVNATSKVLFINMLMKADIKGSTTSASHTSTFTTKSEVLTGVWNANKQACTATRDGNTWTYQGTCIATTKQLTTMTNDANTFNINHSHTLTFYDLQTNETTQGITVIGGSADLVLGNWTGSATFGDEGAWTVTNGRDTVKGTFTSNGEAVVSTNPDKSADDANAATTTGNSNSTD